MSEMNSVWMVDVRNGNVFQNQDWAVVYFHKG